MDGAAFGWLWCGVCSSLCETWMKHCCDWHQQSAWNQRGIVHTRLAITGHNPLMRCNRLQYRFTHKSKHLQSTHLLIIKPTLHRPIHLEPMAATMQTRHGFCVRIQKILTALRLGFVLVLGSNAPGTKGLSREEVCSRQIPRKESLTATTGPQNMGF